MKNPIALIIYHRPELTSRVIQSLREVKPTVIFVIADGPKNREDAKKCEETRKLIDTIDWKCKIYKKYSSKNLGLRNRVVTGLNWVFSKVETAIILEDDLKIDLSFFKFCDDLLERYKNDSRIISISGNNFLPKDVEVKESYFFSHFVYSWGWATWRRAWKLYEDSMSDWPSIRNDISFNKNFSGFGNSLYWKNIFDLTHRKKIDSWAYCWIYTAFKNKKVSIVPGRNLVSNIGFGGGATHTSFKSGVMDLPINKMDFPLRHPESIRANKYADDLIGRVLYLTPRIIIGVILRSLVSRA